MNRLTLEYWQTGLKRHLGRWAGVFSRCLAVIREELRPVAGRPEDPYGSGMVRHPAPQTVIDIGGSHGQFAGEILHRYPGAVIYSFEPLPECFAELEQLAVNHPRLRPFNLALSDAPGQADFNVSAFNDSSSFQPMRDEHLEAWPNTAYARTIRVRKARLDDVLEVASLARPIFVKIDVQGHELAVLAGARKTLAASQRVMLECNFASLYEGQPTFDELYRELKGLGFRLDGMISPLRHPVTGELLSTDLIFYRPALAGQADSFGDGAVGEEG
jgi:FkbM family methyltransferase